MNNLWLIAVLALCLPLALFALSLQPELGGPPGMLPGLQAKVAVYEVRPGDTLAGIASRYGVPVSWLIVSNNLSTTTIYPGQRLLIPKNGVIHIVKPGETLKEIAAKYGVSEESLWEANGLRADPPAGTSLFVPNPQTVPTLERGATEFVWPVHGPISSPFGPRIHPIYGAPSFHTGIDIAVPEGTPVRAAASGTVTFAGWYEGFGVLVVIDHGNGYESYYAHLSKLLVSAGQSVSAGDVIALSGNTGLSTGPHLHFEVRYFGTPVDPRPLLP